VRFADETQNTHRLKPVLLKPGVLGMKLKCPICKQPTDSGTHPEFPFCSERCREHDLGNWAMEKYKVAVPMMDESEPEEIETNEPAQPERLEHEDE
jgi:endogenous inhibitor of DNA gyrase (YacG/DUF329 family)